MSGQSSQSRRLADGGNIDRQRPLSFTFDGRRYSGYHGDTLASALLANDVQHVARSFKYHRPRGIFSAGSEEPSALVTVGTGRHAEPNTRATMVELYDGLVASSQNAWPSLRFDAGAVNNLLSPVFSAGFYYKTFMWPGLRGWRFYERFIRRAAGIGKSSTEPDPDRYERIEAFCDVLVVGMGPAGLAAALTAGRSGARVIVVDENARPPALANAADWQSAALRELATFDDVTTLHRCTAFGYYDGNVLGLVERVGDHLPALPAGVPRQRHWIVRAAKVILATGAIERPLLFANNDLPGIMLASAADRYCSEFAVCPGRETVIYTNNDSAYATAQRLAAHAAVTLIDCRDADDSERPTLDGRISVLQGVTIRSANGGRRVRGITLASGRRLQCSSLLVSGGWTPTIHLMSQAGSRPQFDESLQAFLPGSAREDWIAAGACNSALATRQCLQQGHAAAENVLTALGLPVAAMKFPESSDEAIGLAGPMPAAEEKCFVDLQNDVTIADLHQGVQEGYRSAELLKRYTTLGMGTDQGKTGNVNALALLAAARGESVPAVGVTTFRPPYTAVSIGAIAGRKQRAAILPTRLTPLHDWHVARQAMMNDAGTWKRPLAYPRPGEDRLAAGIREASTVRRAVGVCDVSTLGKIDIQGPDAAEFLERVYINRWKTLQPGKARYGVMLREDGFVFDDGTTSCLADGRYFMTTTTAQAEAVLRHLEFLLQVTWPELRVTVSDVTDQWAAFAVAGPQSRSLLQNLFGEAMNATALPFMAIRDLEYAGTLVRLIRVSFSGELGYELYTPSGFGESLLRKVFDAGKELDVQPYGLDAMDILRIEKGHLTGAEIDGNRTVGDLGLTPMLRPDANSIGSAMMRRPGLLDQRRGKLVGLRSCDPQHPLAAGDHLVLSGKPREPAESLGHIASAAWSPQLQGYIALAFLRADVANEASTLYATSPLAGTHVEVSLCSPHFFDPAGVRLRD